MIARTRAANVATATRGLRDPVTHWIAASVIAADLVDGHDRTTTAGVAYHAAVAAIPSRSAGRNGENGENNGEDGDDAFHYSVEFGNASFDWLTGAGIQPAKKKTKSLFRRSLVSGTLQNLTVADITRLRK